MDRHDAVVPTGRYLHVDPVAGTPVAVEEFSCAAGPAGWRYVATVHGPDGRQTGGIDLTLDGGGRQVRLLVTAGGWELRGGVAGRETLWVRRPADSSGRSGGGRGAGDRAGDGRRAGADAAEPAAVERAEVAAGFAGRSPAFLVAAVRLLRLSAGARARLQLVEVTGPALGTRVVEQGWLLDAVTSYPTETGPLPLGRYRVADLSTGESRELHLAGDVVVAASGLELTALHSPPTL
jgi:hypothetical protein